MGHNPVMPAKKYLVSFPTGPRSAVPSLRSTESVAMSYEESSRYCPSCGRPSWHGRDVVDVFRPRSLTVFSHLITVFNDLLIPWRCLDCGRRSRGKAGQSVKGRSGP